MRRTLLWPTKMLYPANLPVTTVLETLHKDKSANHKRLKVFWIVFTCLLVWELLPEVSLSFHNDYRNHLAFVLLHAQFLFITNKS